MCIQTSCKTNHEIKSSIDLDFDIDVEKTCFFNVKIKLLMNYF